MEEGHRLTEEVLKKAIAKQFNVDQSEIEIVKFDVTGKLLSHQQTMEQF